MFVVFKGYYCQNKKIPGIFPSIFLQPVKGSKNSILNSKSLFFSNFYLPTEVDRQSWNCNSYAEETEFFIHNF